MPIQNQAARMCSLILCVMACFYYFNVPLLAALIIASLAYM